MSLLSSHVSTVAFTVQQQSNFSSRLLFFLGVYYASYKDYTIIILLSNVYW